MANKQKKKRDKAYHGAGAAVTRPSVTRIEAVNRSTVGQWWYDNKRIARLVLIVAGVVAVIIILVYELIRLATGG